MMNRMPLELRAEGLYCSAGDFYIDPSFPVPAAIVTHAHADHALAGSRHYLAAKPSGALLRERLGKSAAIELLDYGQPRMFGDVRVSLHPAGHILGSAQVRIETGDGVCVVSGDYKRQSDPTCQPLEVLPCDIFVTESTFALPVYRWAPTVEAIAEVREWWDACARRGVAAVLFCYALGKAQRILAELHVQGIERMIYLHGAIAPMVDIYRQAGIAMPPTQGVADSAKGRDFGGELVLAPPSASRSPWMRRFANASTGFASGRMRIRGNRRRQGYDRGFVISDHADWPALLRTVRETGARRVFAMHGDSDAFIHYLRERGLDAQTLRPGVT